MLRLKSLNERGTVKHQDSAASGDELKRDKLEKEQQKKGRGGVAHKLKNRRAEDSIVYDMKGHEMTRKE